MLDFFILDINSDRQDKVVTNWLAYGGGSGGTKWSAIFDFTNGKLKISTGYPDLLNIELFKYLWAVLRYTGFLKSKQKNQAELTKILPYLKELGATEAESKALLKNPPNWQLIDKIFRRISSQKDLKPDKFLNLSNGNIIELCPRHTDDFGTFLKIEDRYIFAEAFYIKDSACHWCNHYWRIMAFVYRNGKWISDRIVNGPKFSGDWLDEEKKYSLNDVFGTYPDQGMYGLAFSFLSTDWTKTSKKGISDPYGVEMRVTSPVEKRIRAMYEADRKWP